MLDPSPVLADLVAHVSARLGLSVTPSAIPPQETGPGKAELVVTSADVVAAPEGSSRQTWVIEGYAATYHSPNTANASALLAAVQLVNALNSWYQSSYAQNCEAVENWTVYQAELGLTAHVVNRGGPVLLLVSVDVTLTLNLEVP